MPLDSAETAQLQRDIVSAVTHDLGSIAGALALRAQIPVSADPAAQERQRAILGALADQVRTAMRALEVVRTSGGTSVSGLASATANDLWIEQLSRLAAAVLPRGSTVQVDPPPALPTSTSGLTSTLTLVMLGALHHLNLSRDTGGVQLLLKTEVTAAAVPDAAALLTLTAEVVGRPDGRPLRLSVRRSRWQRYCERLTAERAGTMIWWHHAAPDRLIWQCRFLPATPD